MIIGIGVDIVDVRRIEGAIYRWQDKFLRRVFTDSEIKYCNNKKNPAPRFATRFAAKEALIKALFSRDEGAIEYNLIEISQGRDGRPVIVLYGKAKELASKKPIKTIHLMISHDGNYGVANVVVEG